MPLTRWRVRSSNPGGSALRSAQATQAGPGDRVLVLGPGSIGVLVALFCGPAAPKCVSWAAHRGGSTSSAPWVLGNTWTEAAPPQLPFDAVVHASNARHLPAIAVELVEPAGRVVYVGLAGSPSQIDARDLVLKDVTAVGILSASPGLEQTIEADANGAVDPHPV